MSGDTSQTQSSSTLFSFFNIFDKLKFKKKVKCKTSGIIEDSTENDKSDNQNDKIGYGNNDNDGTFKKSDTKKVLKTSKESGDAILKDMLISKIENYEDIEKFIANNSLKEEGKIVCETIPNKTFEKNNKRPDSEFIVLHQKKQRLRKKIDNEETLPKEDQINEINELNENVKKKPDLNSCGIDHYGCYNSNDANVENNVNNNTNNVNRNNNSNVSKDYNDVNDQKSEPKKRKENKQLKCEYTVENCDVVELNKDLISQLKTLPVNFNEKQLLFMEGKNIKKVVDYNKAIKRCNTLKLKKYKASYLEKPVNSRHANSQSKLVKAIRNENTTFNISRSLIITDNGVENQKIQVQDLSAFSLDNINSVREKALNKKKKRRKTLNAYHELTKPRSNLMIIENNTDNKNICESNINHSLCEKGKDAKQETACLDSVPVRDSKDSSIDQCNVGSKKDKTVQSSSSINHKFLEKHFHNNHPKVRTVLKDCFYNKHDVKSDKITHEQRACPIKERFADRTKEKSVGIEVNFDDKPNESYNFLIESKNCSSSTKQVTNNINFPHDSIRNKLNALKTTALKNNKPLQEDGRDASNLTHIKKAKNVLNDFSFKKGKSNTLTAKYAHADHGSKQKRLPYTLVKKSFIPDMEHKEYISVANIRVPLKLKSETQTKVPVNLETKFKTNNGQHANEVIGNSSPREKKLEENNHKNCNILKGHTNFCGDCFVDKDMQTNEAGCKLRLKNSRENIKIRDKGDYVPDESEVLANMFIKIIKNLKAGNADSVESMINDNDLLSKCLKLVNSENYITSSREKFVRVIENTEIENWKTNTKHVDSLQKSSKFMKSEDHSVCSRDNFVRVTESSNVEQNQSVESSSVYANSVLKFSNVLKHKCISAPDKNNFVRIVKISEHRNRNTTESSSKQYLNDFVGNSCLKDNNTSLSVPIRERTLTDFCDNENSMSTIENHPRLSVNFVNVSKNRVVNSVADHSEPWHSQKHNSSTGEIQTLSENAILNKKMSDAQSSQHSHYFSDSDYKFRNDFVFTDFSSIKRSIDSNENVVNNTNNDNFNSYQPETCGEIEQSLINRKFKQLYVVKPDDSIKNLLEENEQNINTLMKSKCNIQHGNIGDFSSTWQDNKSIQNYSSVGIKNMVKSASDSNLSLKNLSTEKIIFKESDYSGTTLCKNKFKKQQNIISKDMGINTDVYTTESEYLFNKCISVLTEHLTKIYELCDKQKYSSNESGNESCSDNVNFKKKASGSGYSLCRDDCSGNVKFPCCHHCNGEYRKANEEMYNLLLLMVTNNVNVSEMTERNDAFVNNLRDVVCQYTEKRFKELNKSIAELSKKVSEVVKKHSNDSVRTSDLIINSKTMKYHNGLNTQEDRSETEVDQKTSEILELMKVIESTDINTSGCSDLNFLENKDYKRNCEISENKINMDNKNVMRFQVEVQLNDTMQVDKIVIEGS